MALNITDIRETIMRGLSKRMVTVNFPPATLLRYDKYLGEWQVVPNATIHSTRTAFVEADEVLVFDTPSNVAALLRSKGPLPPPPERGDRPTPLVTNDELNHWFSQLTHMYETLQNATRHGEGNFEREANAIGTAMSQIEALARKR